MPVNWDNYPPNWKEIRARIQQRAGNKCEGCEVPNYAWVWRDDLGAWHSVGEQALREAGYHKPPFTIPAKWQNGGEGVIRVIKIICTTAHLDHDTQNNSDDNLRFWCQRCHLTYDAALHARHAATTRRTQKEEAGQQRLFSQEAR